MSASPSPNLGVFGYLPGQPDFVRVRSAGREVRRLEDWLERAMHQARWGIGAGFSVAYPRLFHRFIFRPDNSQRAVIGVLCASVDRHQRPFPFVAFELVSTEVWDHQPADLIGRNGAFFVAMEDLVRIVGPLAHIGQVHGQVVGTCAPVLLGESAASDDDDARYANFLQETTCGELGSTGTVSGTAVCRDLLALFGSGQDPRLFRQALAIPLSRPQFARALELRFYLSFLLSLLSDGHPTLTLFWQLGGAAPGSLVVSFREPTLDVFLELIGQGSAARGVHRPGSAFLPLSRPHPELVDATTLSALLALAAQRTPSTSMIRRMKDGTRL